MKIKKIAAALAAAAMAVSMVAINAFAATVTLDSDYPGAWSLSKGIPKTEFEAIGGDVKVVFDVVIKEPLVGEHNHLARPTATNWTAVEGCKGNGVIAKSDGMIAFADTQTKLEIIVPEAAWQSLEGYADDNSDAAFCMQVNDVYFTSAELSPADGSQSDFIIIEEEDAKLVFDGTLTPDSISAADNNAPAADTAPTTTAATGNVPAAVMVSVMAVAGAAAVASKKRK